MTVLLYPKPSVKRGYEYHFLCTYVGHETFHPVAIFFLLQNSFGVKKWHVLTSQIEEPHKNTMVGAPLSWHALSSKHNRKPATGNTTDGAIQPTSGAAAYWVSNDPPLQEQEHQSRAHCF